MGCYNVCLLSGLTTVCLCLSHGVWSFRSGCPTQWVSYDSPVSPSKRIFLGAGCVWNDILDRDLDRLVERTKHRPIASGQVSVPGALIFTLMHLVVLIACIWPFNKYAWYMGLVAIFPLPGIYPLMKRITYWPQAWLGVAVNFPAAVTIMALRPNATMSAAMLVVAGWCWTLHYDTIYGSQDKKDDVKAGVKSTALLFGQHARPMLSLFSSLMVSCLAIAGIFNRQAAWFLVVSVGGGALHFFYQIFSVNTESPQSCLKFFESNAWQLGGIIWAGLFLDYLFV
ncbi:4-hydroxybenzoate octaprenyltransferase [Moniliophthora roreri MCA 2997]|uniref:4-hydroxybenzoate octaprenyltransferase n=1 Tax=Moniliophthora roreri (strain MCA 2997) TaxID=1381753 RepID=V2XAG8_MONRO|nr:4-hydroxybenzoate octaprenyltransferase [Moniliophthora roreri MCA 2997]